MLELLLAIETKKPAVLYPDSGPGNKYLNEGTEDLGFFAKVPTTLMISEPDLRAQVGYQGGTSTGLITEWVKMFVNGKVIFFPNKPMASGVSWDSLYNAGIAQGVDGPGVPGNLLPKNQLKYVLIGSDVFKIRLFSVDPMNPTDWTGTVSLPQGRSALGEWCKVVCSICQPAASGWVGPNWKVYFRGDFDIGVTTTWSMNTAPGTIGERHAFTSTQLRTQYQNVGSNWLPVLELVPVNERPLFPINNQQTDLQTNSKPLIPMLGGDTPVVLPVNRQGYEGIQAAQPLYGDTTNIPILDAIPKTSVSYKTDLPLALVPSVTFE